MSRGRFVDASQFQQGTPIDWNAYKQWSLAGDGISRVSLRASYGVGYRDTAYNTFRAAAEAVGIDIMIHYHYAYPDYVAAMPSARWHANCIGGIPSKDIIMLDYEEKTPAATSDWALEWLAVMRAAYPNNMIIFYSYSNFIENNLQDIRLTQYPLLLAAYLYSPDETPPCPKPWSSYIGLQYTDKGNVPGFSQPVDTNVWIGATMNEFQTQDMLNIWNMFSVLMGKEPPPYTTGIATAWKGQYPTQDFGSPFGVESDSVDDNGDPVKVQLFSGGINCRWNVKTGGPAVFTTATGQVLYKGY